MNPAPTRSDIVLTDNVRLYVDFRDAPISQIADYINQIGDLVRTTAAFTYLIIDQGIRPVVLMTIRDLTLDDYFYLDLEPDHQLAELNIDIVVATSPRMQHYENVSDLVSGRAKNLPTVINADHVPIDRILSTVKGIYTSRSGSL